jgi:hypothetical protein
MADAVDPRIAAYKRVLARVLEQRPSGTRQRLADALGKHRSFITQIASPAYATPIPSRHLSAIFAVCHFGAAERDAFMAAYGKAHGNETTVSPERRDLRQLTLPVPDLGDDRKNAALDRAVGEFVNKVVALMTPAGGKR